MFGNRRNTNDLFKIFDEIFSQFEQPNGEWKTNTRISEDGSTMITTRYWSNSNTTPKTDFDKLKSQLEVAIENEDFEKAVELRDKIKTLETSRKEIEELELELKKSIEEQNFEKSIKLRDKIKSLKK